MENSGNNTRVQNTIKVLVLVLATLDTVLDWFLDKCCCWFWIAKLCLTFCNSIDYSTWGFPVLHYLPEFAQTHVHWVGYAIYLILCHPILLLPSGFPSIRVFYNELALHIRYSKYWRFSFSVSPSNEYSGLISFRIDWFDLLAIQGLSRVFSSTTVWRHQFYSTQPSLWSSSHIRTWLLDKP